MDRTISISFPTSIERGVYFKLLAAGLLLSYLCVVLSVPVLEPLLGFGFFTLVPGVLLLQLIGLTDDLSGAAVSAMTVGLGIGFLYAVGFGLNLMGVVYPTPLRGFIVVNGVAGATALLLAVTWYRTPTRPLRFPSWFDQSVSLRGLAPVVIPVVAVAGALLLRTTGNNLVALSLLVFIATTLVYVSFRGDSWNYSLLILCIGLALALAHGVRSPYVFSEGDIAFEYYTFQQVLEAGRWHPRAVGGSDTYGALLSLTVLPVVYNQLTGLDVLVYNGLYRVIEAFIPLTAFVTFRNYLDDRRAFFAAFFVVAQFTFIVLIGTIARMNVAFLFFFLTVFVAFDRRLSDDVGAVLFLVFGVGIVVSHYTTALILLVLLVQYKLLRGVSRLLGDRWAVLGAYHQSTRISNRLVGAFAAAVLVWYGLVSVSVLPSIVEVFTTMVTEISQFTLADLQSGGGSGEPVSMAYRITEWVHYATIAITGVGVLTLLVRVRDSEFDANYVLFMLPAMGILAGIFLLNRVYGAYGEFRTLFQMLVFIAPAFVIGVESLGRLGARLPKVSVSSRTIRVLVVVVLLVQFAAGTYGIFQLFGIPYAEYLNDEGDRYERAIVEEDEYVAAQWLCRHNTEDRAVWGDYYGEQVVAQCDAENARDGLALEGPGSESLDGYVYLRCENTRYGKLYSNYEPPADLSSIDRILEDKELVFSEGCAAVYG